MSFIAKNPLTMPEINYTPSTPSGTRGIFAKEDGWYETDSMGNVSKLGKDDSRVNSYIYYGNPDIIPSASDMFTFEVISEDDKTVKVSKKNNDISGDIVIPYECKINNKMYKVIEIADNAFGYMEGVTGIIIPSSVKIIGSFMATSCSKIKEIVIPDGVTIVGAYAFAGCSGLEKIEISNSVTSIESAVFNSCYKLMTVNMPDGLTTIYSDTFANCGALTNINIGKSVSKIENYAFNYCSELINISIPKSIKTIENSAFWGCDKLEDVWYEGTEEEWKSIAIDGNNNPLVNATIHYKSVPATKGYVDEQSNNKVDNVDENGNFLTGSHRIDQSNVGNNILIGKDAYCSKGNGISIGTGSGVYTDNGIAIGHNAIGDSSFIAIGNGASTGYGIAIGHSSNSFGNGIAIGSEAKVSADYGIQLGTGTNDEEGTLKVFDYTLMNKDGSLPYVDEAIKNIQIPKGVVPIKSSVNILGGVQNWTLENIEDSNGNVVGSRYGQVVNVNNAEITPNSKVDLQITSEQMVVFYEKSLAFVAENDNGVVTVYCVGSVPENDYTIQAVVTEVVVND